MDHNDSFIESEKNYGFQGTPIPSGASRVTADGTSWESYSILKDDAKRRDVWFGEYVSILGGDSLKVIQPPFTILPVEDVGGGALELQGGPQSKTFEIKGLFFDYAWPVLTGWDLSYPYKDEEVREIGVMLRDISYVKDAAGRGTLRYTLESVLRNAGEFPHHLTRHKVNILGIDGPHEPGDGPVASSR